MSTVAESAAVRPLPLKWRQGLFGELWAEFFGCFVLICFGDGVVAMLWALMAACTLSHMFKRCLRHRPDSRMPRTPMQGWHVRACRPFLDGQGPAKSWGEQVDGK